MARSRTTETVATKSEPIPEVAATVAGGHDGWRTSRWTLFCLWAVADWSTSTSRPHQFNATRYASGDIELRTVDKTHTSEHRGAQCTHKRWSLINDSRSTVYSRKRGSVTVQGLHDPCRTPQRIADRDEDDRPALTSSNQVAAVT